MPNPSRHFSISGNSSKVESTGRTLVALVFLTALRFDPLQPVRDNLLGECLLGGFLGWSIVLIAVAWRSWWWDHRLARAAHAIDIAVFVGAVYYTEAPSTDFSSPFMAFAVLLLIKARVRWDWRATAVTALVLLALNLTVAGTMAWNGFAIDLQRVGRRAAYMVLLAVLLVWMGLERRVKLDLPFPLLPPETAIEPDVANAQPHPIHLLLATALSYARDATIAGHAAIAWNAKQEPWIELGTSQAQPGQSRPGNVRITRLGPELLAPPSLQAEAPGSLADRQAALFASARQRALTFGAEGQRIARRMTKQPALAAHLGVDTGISVPIVSDAGNGRLLLWDLADPGFDRLAHACQVAEEIGRAFEREERARLEQVVAVNGAVSGVREAIARDLHDSAAQFLAGTMFRLEALRRRISADQDTDAGSEIVAIKNAMRLEQLQLRHLIGQLRRGKTADRQTDLRQELAALLSEVGANWHLVATLDCAPGPMTVPITLSHEVRQLVREGLANAARHGGGDTVLVELATAGAWLRLTITDNGQGFSKESIGPDGEIRLRPRSIAGRVAALGGTLAIMPAEPHGAKLSIGLPLRPVAGKGSDSHAQENSGDSKPLTAKV